MLLLSIIIGSQVGKYNILLNFSKRFFQIIGKYRTRLCNVQLQRATCKMFVQQFRELATLGCNNSAIHGVSAF